MKTKIPRLIEEVTIAETRTKKPLDNQPDTPEIDSRLKNRSCIPPQTPSTKVIVKIDDRVIHEIIARMLCGLDVQGPQTGCIADEGEDRTNNVSNKEIKRREKESHRPNKSNCITVTIISLCDGLTL